MHYNFFTATQDFQSRLCNQLNLAVYIYLMPPYLAFFSVRARKPCQDSSHLQHLLNGIKEDQPKNDYLIT